MRCEMKALGQYDGSLQMFIQTPREPDARHLQFLRWLVEHGDCEHGVAGPPGGPYAPSTPDPWAERPLAA